MLEKEYKLFYDNIYIPQYDMIMDTSSMSKIRQWYLTKYLRKDIYPLPPHFYDNF